jgi:hypothetical protein
MITSSSSIYYSTNAQVNSSNININNGFTQPIISPANINNTFLSDEATNSGNNWTIISGNWTILNGTINGGSSENTTSLYRNIILDSEPSSNSTDVFTSAQVNNLDTTTANYASIVYSFVNVDNYKVAGINLYNNAVYAVGYNVQDGNDVAEPSWPGILTDLTWSPGATYNIEVIDHGSHIGLSINGTEYLTFDDNQNDLGNVGLNYGRVQNISFLDYQTGSTDQSENPDFMFEDINQDSFTVSDSQTIFLEGESFPENSYIHLYDSSPYQILSGHIAAKLPCDEDSNSEVVISTGQAPDLNSIDLEYISDLSSPGEVCLYHANINSSPSNPVTDISIGNNSTDDVDFPDTSSVVISVTEISRIG